MDDDYVDFRRDSTGTNKSRFKIGGFWAEFLATWVSRLETLLKNDQSKFDIPRDFNLLSTTESFRSTYDKLKKVELTVHMFTLDNLLGVYLLIIMAKCCEVGVYALIYMIIRLYNLPPNGKEVMNFGLLRIYLAGALVLEVARFSLKHFATYKAERLGLTIVSSLNYLVKTALFKKDIEVNYNLGVKEYLDLLDKHNPSFERYPIYHLFVIEFSIHFLLTTTFGFYIFRINFFGGFLILLIGFLVVSSMMSGPTKSRSKFYQKAKLQRIANVLELVRSKLHIKARGWEMIFFNKIFRIRQRELDARSSLINAGILQGWLLWSISFASLVVILIIAIRSGQNASFFYFIIFARLYLEYYFLFREILFHRHVGDERKACVTAVEEFSQSREAKSVVSKEDPQVKNYYSLFLQSAYFSWNDVNKIKLKKMGDNALFEKFAKENPKDMIFEEDEADEDDEGDGPRDEEIKETSGKNGEHSREHGFSKIERNSFLENSVAYTLKSESNAKKIRYEPGQIAGHDLTNLNLKVKKGTMCFIYGESGAGKTSIIKALLGEMLLDERFKAKVSEQT